MSEDDWAPWNSHNGLGRPDGFEVGRYAAIRGVHYNGEPHYAEGYLTEADMVAPQLFWGHYPLEVQRHMGKVLDYRFLKPRGLVILEGCLRDVEREGVPA